MGCGGSKDEVAAGNTIAAKSLKLNKSFPPNTSTVGSEVKSSLPPVDSATSETKEAAAAAALISKDSPDRYFSSRKDEETIAGGDVLNKDDEQLMADAVSVVEDSSEVKSDGEVKLFVEGTKSLNEKMTEGGKDFEEASSEEKGTEEIVADKKNYK